MAGQTPERSLAGVHVLVTGATSGLGAAMAAALLAAGATVAAAARPGPRLDARVRTWQEQGLPAVAVPTDVREEVSVAHAAAWVERSWPRLDLVVNNAGIGMRTVNPDFMARPQPFDAVPLDRFLDVFATNVTGYFLVAKAFTPLFVRQGRGRFVNISINQQTMIRRGFVPYGPSRAASEALSQCMAEDLQDRQITVNLLLPGGATATGMIPDAVPQAVRERLLPAEIMGPPIVFLASPEAEGVTGQRIVATDWESWIAALHAARQSPQSEPRADVER